MDAVQQLVDHGRIEHEYSEESTSSSAAMQTDDGEGRRETTGRGMTTFGRAAAERRPDRLWRKRAPREPVQLAMYDAESGWGATGRDANNIRRHDIDVPIPHHPCRARILRLCPLAEASHTL